MKFFILSLAILLFESCDGKILKSEIVVSEKYSIGEIECKGCCRKHDRFDAARSTDKYYSTFYFRNVVPNYNEHQFVDLKQGYVICFKLVRDSFESGRIWTRTIGFEKVSR